MVMLDEKAGHGHLLFSRFPNTPAFVFLCLLKLNHLIKTQIPRLILVEPGSDRTPTTTQQAASKNLLMPIP